VQEHGLGSFRLHAREHGANPLEIDAGSGAALEVGRRGRLTVGVLGGVVIEDATLAAACPESVEGDVARDGRRPGRQAAGPRIRSSRKRQNDLLERGLDEVIVVVLATPEHAIERAIDDAEQAIVELAGHELVTALHRIDDLLVAWSAKVGIGTPFDHPKAGPHGL